MSYSETKLQNYFSYSNNEKNQTSEKPQLLAGGKANVNKGSVSKQSPEGKTINIKTILQKSITITG